MELVLIISAKFNRGLTEAVYKRGMIPLVYSDMELALFAMRRTGFKAALVNGQGGKIDVLETVLNLIDIKPEIPIMIVGIHRDHERTEMLKKLSAVVMIIKDQAELEQKLTQLHLRREV